MSTFPPPSPHHASSQGHALAGVDWLDAHFEAERPEYEALLRSVGLRRGWHVLDAGCGAGGFLPLIAAEVGPTGRITALDLAPENVAVVAQRVAAWRLDCPVSTQVGSVLDLPLADGGFDAVWCANTSQYLSDDELRTALTEFRRLVRPGGLVALKEANIAGWNYGWDDPGRMWRALDATRGTDAQVHGMLRTPQLRRWLEAAGYVEVWQRTLPCERWAPLRAAERQFHGDTLRWFGQLAVAVALSEEDRAFWRRMQQLDDPEHPINQPDFAVFSGQSVVVGRVPSRTD
jgi:arsenite methyltransferase